MKLISHALKVADVAKLVKGDKPELRVLAVFSPTRAPELPDVPTLGEKGLYPEWYGSARAIVAPKGTSPEIIKFYVDAFKKTMQDPATIGSTQEKPVFLWTSRMTNSLVSY